MEFRVDLHIHTLLSPCAGLDMSPQSIVLTALDRGLDAIAVTDHNHTAQTAVVERAGRAAGLRVFAGVELTTREEAHCIALFDNAAQAAQIQPFIDRYIVKIDNDPEKLGDQVWVDDRENIEGEVEWYLNMPIDRSVEQIAQEVKRLGGLFVPAHVERPSYSIIGQLGFIAPDLPVDAVEYNSAERYAALVAHNRYLGRYTAYTASDAHSLNLIGTRPSVLKADSLTLDSLATAMHNGQIEGAATTT